MTKRAKTNDASNEPVKLDAAGYIRCRVCSCTDVKSCEPPCGWADTDLCTSCRDGVIAVLEWRERAHRPSLRALIREVERRLDTL